ncbi:MAG: hypothetical protein KGK44_11685 [Gammaproteobacteria bacterium]|nr:hypothetical protein [Gammaproteobacteria bacterium]
MASKYAMLLLVLSIVATSIRAETVNCTPITSLPATISAQGIYCLTGNLGTNITSGNAITISANNVTIDLNSWKLDGGSAGINTSTFGIFSYGNNVTIKNGIVRGFIVGIYQGGSGDVVQDVLVDTGYYAGIWVDGPGALVEHNQVVNSGNYNNYANGIISSGANSTVSDNIVSGLTSESGLDEYGISANGPNSIIRKNVVSNGAIPSNSNSYGIYVSDGGIVANNAVSTFTFGIDITNGGIYSFNTVNGCTTPFAGGTAGAGNSND